MPHPDNKTRWNSWYNMLDWATNKTKSSIIAVSNEEADLAHDTVLGIHSFTTTMGDMYKFTLKNTRKTRLGLRPRSQI